MKRKILVLAALLVVVVLGLSGCAASPAASGKKENAAPAATEAVTAAPTAAPAAAGEEEKAEETGPIIEPQASGTTKGICRRCRDGNTTSATATIRAGSGMLTGLSIRTTGTFGIQKIIIRRLKKCIQVSKNE